jgi:hypothetical protein
MTTQERLDAVLDAVARTPTALEALDHIMRLSAMAAEAVLRDHPEIRGELTADDLAAWFLRAALALRSGEPAVLDLSAKGLASGAN